MQKFLRTAVFAYRCRVAQVFDVDDVFAESSGGQLLQLYAVARFGFVGNQNLGGIYAKFGFRGSRRSTSAQPGQLFAHEVAATGLTGGR